jgi:hypothetical protein
MGVCNSELIALFGNLFANNCNSAKISECFSVSKFKPTVMMHAYTHQITNI